MQENQGIFTIKLQQLEQQYDKVQSCLYFCQEKDYLHIHQALQQLESECQKNDILLQWRVVAGRSLTAAEMAAAQLQYNQNIREVLKRAMLLHGYVKKEEIPQEQAEIMALYAEYAIDFAIQALQHTMLAILSAIDLQMVSDEKKKYESVE